MEFVKIAHPGIEALGECALSALPIWEGLGWHRVDEQSAVADLGAPPDAGESVPTPSPSPKASRKAASTEE